MGTKIETIGAVRGLKNFVEPQIGSGKNFFFFFLLVVFDGGLLI